ncbi:protein enabled homolog isoform X2 [Lepisosteus oculatus]|uniref:protein enabled homolog isoform X2 n=1 Tax=Lepisosteus oculatus TaxID=7918 RepID=UPI00073FCB5E|nr:PREDICTED: uncharacterized protein LOC107078042 isoform X2 [Lepisosteus oculatus]
MEKEGEVLTDVIGLHPYSDRENFALIQEQMTEHSDLVETRMKKEKKEREEKGQTGFSEEQRRQEEYCLLAELARIEQELREKSRKELERQEALERARSEANRDRWRNLSYMALSQRVNKYVPIRTQAMGVQLF